MLRMSHSADRIQTETPSSPFLPVTDRLYSQGCEARDRKRADMKKRLDEVPNALEGTGANIAKTTPSNWSRGTRDKRRPVLHPSTYLAFASYFMSISGKGGRRPLGELQFNSIFFRYLCLILATLVKFEYISQIKSETDSSLLWLSV